MAKRKRVHRSRKTTIPIGLLAGVFPGVWDGVRAIQTGDAGLAGTVILRDYTGIDLQTQRFDGFFLWRGLYPLIAGMMVHRFVGGSLGVNRSLAAAGVPFIRI